MRSLPESPGRFIMRISNGLRGHLDAFVEGTSMTTAEARALQFIAAAEPVHQRDIEEEYGCTAATVSELMANMESKGLIRRETDPRDRRKKCVTINDAIRPQVNAMLEKMIEMEQKLVEGIDDDEVAVFLEVAKRMSKNIPPKAE